jgi:hypothetical protein
MAVASFNRSNIGTMRAEVEAALNAVAAKHGLAITLGRITFTGNEFRGKLTAVTRAAVPNTINAPNNPIGQPPADPRRSVEAVALRNNLYLLGLKDADLNNVYRSAIVGDTCTLIGYAPRRHKYPFTIRTGRGKTLKVTRYTAQQIVQAANIVKAA